MLWWQNIPLFSIILCLLSAAVTSVLKRRAARTVCLGTLSTVLFFTVILTGMTRQAGTATTFMMGHFPAPWGNEIRFGVLEAVTAALFTLIMLFSLSGGGHRMAEQLEENKENLYYTVCALLEAALLAQVYSNDLFTSYVFVEIMTIAACTLITARTKGKTLVSAMRYMILNLLGSGLFLLGVVLLYNMTGHLLMVNIREQVGLLMQTGEYRIPLTVTVGLLTVGLAIKSSLFPFHTWVPDAYANGTPSSNAILSSLVSKGYIFLLIKVYVRVLGTDTVNAMGIFRVLLAFAAGGIIVGSVDAIRTKHIGRMIAYSSVAQIGYIYLGVSLGTDTGMQIAIFQMLSHGFAKSLLFLSSDVLRKVSGESTNIADLKGSGLRAPLAGVCFTTGALSMVGIPLTGGFVTKLLLIRESMSQPAWIMVTIWILMLLSTLLNVLYFLKTVMIIWTHPDHGPVMRQKNAAGIRFGIAAAGLSAAVLACFLFAGPLLSALSDGLALFS